MVIRGFFVIPYEFQFLWGNEMGIFMQMTIGPLIGLGRVIIFTALGLLILEHEI